MKQHRESPIARTNPSGSRVWIGRYTSPEGRRLSAGTYRLKREAQAAIDNAYQQPQATTLETVAAYLERWLTDRPRSPRTDHTNRGRIRAVLGLELDGLPVADWPMRSLRRRHRDQLIALLLTEQGRSPGGARNILRALSAMFEDAITDELAITNPWQGAKVRDNDPRAISRSRVPRVWTFDQMHALARRAGCGEPAIRILADCGLRIGELFALRREHLCDGVLVVQGSAWEGRIVESSHQKNHCREVPIPAGCMTLLRAMPPRIDTPWLFPTASGQLWRYSNWKRQVWQPACAKAGIDPTPHELRHSWVSHMRAAGVDPADLADVAGHSIQVASASYTHALRRSHEEIRKAIG